MKAGLAATAAAGSGRGRGLGRCGTLVGHHDRRRLVRDLDVLSGTEGHVVVRRNVHDATLPTRRQIGVGGILRDRTVDDPGGEALGPHGQHRDLERLAVTVTEFHRLGL